MSAPTRKAPAKRRSPKAAARPADVELELPDDLNAMGPVAEDIGPIAEDGSIRPVIIGKRGRKGEDGPVRHHIFTLDDVDYSIPDPSIALVLKYFRDLRKHGRDGAIENMAFALLGEEALTALAESPDTSEEDVADVFTIVGKIFFHSPAYLKATNAAGPS